MPAADDPTPLADDEPSTGPLDLDAGHDLSTEEIRLLWSFIHGDIMDSQTRGRLRDYWGLCDRHTWGYAVTEIELWESGAGTRGGHQPFDVSILYADLLDTMIQRLHRTEQRTRKVRP